MDKFSLFDFITKLSTSKEAQTSLSTMLNKLFFNSNKKNDSVAKTSDNKNNFNNTRPNFNSDVYRSPEAYTLYNEMIEKTI